MATNHRPQFWTRVDSVVIVLLENDKYLTEARAKELTKIVKDKFQVTPRMAQKYIAEARKVCQKLGEQKRDEAYERAIRDREFLFKKAKDKIEEDPKFINTALDIVKDRDKLKGLYIEKVEHSGKIDLGKINLQKLTDEQLSTLESLIKQGKDPKPFLLSLGIEVDD